MTTGTLQNVSTARTIAERVDCATTQWTRLRGLLGRRCLLAGEGVWIRPSSGIHTLGMRFAIDAVGLDKDLRVIKLWPGLRPWRIPPPSLRLASVVELAAGEIAARGIRLGHVLRFDPHPCRVSPGVLLEFPRAPERRSPAYAATLPPALMVSRSVLRFPQPARSRLVPHLLAMPQIPRPGGPVPLH